MITIYLDLDGTILDVRQRLCIVYRDTVAELEGEAMPLRVYWWCKKTHVPEETVARWSLITNTQRYTELRRKKLESPAYLSCDKVLPQVLKGLTELRKSNRLVLATMRVNVDSLHTQLQELSLSPLLDTVLARGSNAADTKVDMISRDTGFKSGTSVIVGDTENDILTGKSLGIRAVSVLNGIRGESTLVRHQPDHIIDDIGQLAELLSE